MSPSNKKKSSKPKGNKATPKSEPQPAPSLSGVPPPPPDAPLPPPAPTTSAEPVSSPQPTITATTFDFKFFLKNANYFDIIHFLNEASNTQDGKNLKSFWKRAYNEGRTSMWNEFQATLEEERKAYYQEGKLHGLEEGAKNERERWTSARHGPSCLSQIPVAMLNDQSSQTDPIAATTSSTCEAGTQVDSQQLDSIPKPPILPQSSTTTTSISTQTSTDANPLNNPKSMDILSAFSFLSSSTLHFNASIQTDNPPSLPIHPESATMTRLDWAEDVALSLDPPLPLPPPQVRQPRDLSDLRSQSAAPFSSLQHRSNRFKTRSRHQSRCRYIPFHADFSQPSHSALRNRPLFSHFYHKPQSYHSSHNHFQQQDSSALDWESDPRLRDLSRALKTLGWIRTT